MSDQKNLPIITPVALARFMSVFEPRVATGPDANPNATPKYEINLVFAPDTDLTELKQAALRAGEILFKTKDRSQWPKFKNPLFKKAEDLKAKHYGAYPGCTVLVARTTDPVGLVDANVQPIVDRRQLYAGCSVRAQVKFGAYNKLGNAGLSCYLINVQKVSDGEPLSGGPRAEDAFAPVQSSGHDDDTDDSAFDSL